MRYGLLVFFWIGLAGLARGQTPFTANWSFNNTTGGSSSHPNVGIGGADLIGVVTNNLAPYVAGQNGQAANIGGWSQSPNCNFNEFVQVSVQPLNGQRMTLSQISFYINNSSSSGPQQVRVRSSADNFGSDLAVQGVSTSFQLVSIGLSGGSYTNQSGAITFRIYACNGTGGTIRLDELNINGTVTTTLPVELLYFRAQPQGNAVALSWATTWERNAGKFTIQRSRDLSEFLTIGEVAATGNTDSRQTYAFTDQWPDAGTTYYRLLQTDRDGATQQAKPVAVTLDDDTPALAVLDNPAPAEALTIATRNLTGAEFRLVSLTGQSVIVTADNQENNASIVRPNGIISAGLYWLQAIRRDGRTVGARVLIR